MLRLPAGLAAGAFAALHGGEKRVTQKRVVAVDHAIPVELARNRLRTIAVGSGELDLLSLPFLPVNADVIDGDLLISSGLGGTFPPGYPVGVIRKIKEITGQPFLQVDAEPAAALNRIREVLLISPQGGDEYTDVLPEVNDTSEAGAETSIESDTVQAVPAAAEATP